jgi:hypothetical protein
MNSIEDFKPLKNTLMPSLPRSRCEGAPEQCRFCTHRLCPKIPAKQWAPAFRSACTAILQRFLSRAISYEIFEEELAVVALDMHRQFHIFADHDAPYWILTLAAKSGENPDDFAKRRTSAEAIRRSIEHSNDSNHALLDRYEFLVARREERLKQGQETIAQSEAQDDIPF